MSTDSANSEGEENKTEVWGGYWSSKRKSIGKAILDIMREYYFKWVVIHLVGDVTSKNVLEAGCGSAESLVLLNKKAKKMYGLELSEDALKIAEDNFRKKGISQDRYELKLGDINNIPYSDNVFDIVFNAGVIEHFTDVTPIKEMIRVTKPGGRVVILVPANGLYHYVFKILERFLFKDEISWHEHKFYSKKMMRQELYDSGAQKIEVYRSISSLGVYMVGIVRK